MDYSLNFNAARKCWIAKYKDNSNWKQKWIPTSIKSNQEIEARNYLNNFFAGVSGPALKQSVSEKTIRNLYLKWLDLREKDIGTKPNTLHGFKLSLKNHILPSSIADLDIVTELDVSAVRDWAMALRTSYSSRLSHLNTLSRLIVDSINEGWLPESLDNIVEKQPIKKIIKEFKRSNDAAAVITHLDSDAVSILLTRKNSKLKDIRRIKYLLAIATGLRDMEICGLIFDDIKEKDGIKYLDVRRQLYKKGKTPHKSYQELEAAGLSKKEIFAQGNAITALPKYNSSRIIPIHPLLESALNYLFNKLWKQYTGTNPTKDSPIFPRSKTSINNNAVAGSFCDSDSAVVFQLDLQRLDLPPNFQDTEERFTFHSLRHTFSTLLDSVGVESEKIGVLLGHKAKTVTRKNYIAQNLVTFQRVINSLPLPEKITLKGIDLVADATKID